MKRVAYKCRQPRLVSRVSDAVRLNGDRWIEALQPAQAGPAYRSRQAELSDLAHARGLCAVRDGFGERPAAYSADALGLARERWSWALSQGDSLDLFGRRAAPHLAP